MTGELAAVVAAIVWAFTGLLLKYLSTGFHPLHLNHIRSISASILFGLFLFSTGEIDLIYQYPVRSAIIASGGTFIAVAIGESLFVHSLRYIELARAYPISVCGWPVITLVISLFFLDEMMKKLQFLGVFLVLTGLYFLTFSGGSSPWRFSFNSRKEKIGLFVLGLTVLSWGAGTVLIKVGAEGQSLSGTNFIRFTVTSIVLVPFTYKRWGEIRAMKRVKEKLMLAVISGILGFGAGGLLFIVALTKSGAGMTSVLSSTSPLFILPMSVVFFREKVTSRKIIGVIVSVLGVSLLFFPKIQGP